MCFKSTKLQDWLVILSCSKLKTRSNHIDQQNELQKSMKSEWRSQCCKIENNFLGNNSNNSETRTTSQAWILASHIGEYLANNRVMSNEGCSTTDKVVRREVKQFFYKLLTS